MAELSRPSSRQPLAEEHRRRISGQPGSTLIAGHASPIDLTSCPGAGAHGLVYFGQRVDDGDGFEPDDARRLAIELLAMADFAEFGPGEWHNGEWRPDA